jgi:hypothetical protein
MGLFSPIAGLVMCLALWLMFRSVALVVAKMFVAIVSIVWSMGLLIGLRYRGGQNNLSTQAGVSGSVLFLLGFIVRAKSSDRFSHVTTCLGSLF